MFQFKYLRLFLWLGFLLIISSRSGYVNAQFLVFEQKLISPDGDFNSFGYRIKIAGDRLLISSDANGK